MRNVSLHPDIKFYKRTLSQLWQNLNARQLMQVMLFQLGTGIVYSEISQVDYTYVSIVLLESTTMHTVLKM